MTDLSAKEQKAREIVCLPLDGLHSIDAVRDRVEELSPFVGFFKVGKETFTRFGPDIVNIVKGHGAGVFLDLKYHDIPSTVKGAARAAAELGVSMFNVHAIGGLTMMKAAMEGIDEADITGGGRPKIVAVTVLTSIDQEILNLECGILGSVEDLVYRLSELTAQAGLDGIVCSAVDLPVLKDSMPSGFMFVTPGIKGTTTAAGEDQKRVLTPGAAVQAGSTMLVVGRAITGADDRTAAAREVLDDIVRVLE